MTTDLWWTLSHGSFAAWWELMQSAFVIKAPGIAWAGQFFVPLGQAMGSVDDGLLACGLIFQGGTLLLLFRLGYEISGRGLVGGWLAAIVAAAAPLFAGLSHNFFVEPLQTLSVTAFFWIAWNADHWSRWRVLLLLLLAASVGMAAKISTPLYVFAPGAVALVRSYLYGRWREANRRTGILVVLGWIITATVTAVVLAWYYRNLTAVAHFIRSSSQGDLALNYGHAGAFGEKLLFWLRMSRQALGTTWVVYALVVTAFVSGLAAWGQLRFRIVFRPSLAGIITLAASAEIAVVLATFARQINEETRYLLPVLPSFVVVLIYLLSRLKTAWPFAVALALATVQFVITHGHAQGFIVSSGVLNNWLQPATTDPRQDREIRKLVKMLADEKREDRYVTVGLELAWLNANTFSYYAAKNRFNVGRRDAFTSLGYAQKDPEVAWIHMLERKTLYFISLEPTRHPQPPDFLNGAALPVLQRVALSPEFQPVTFDSREGIVLYRYLE